MPESKINVSFIGESLSGTVLTYDDYASKKNIFGEEMSTSGSASFYVYAPDFIAENLTFENSAGPVGQAVAVLVSEIVLYSGVVVFWAFRIRCILIMV